MKNKSLILVIGILVGAIITTSAFLIYNNLLTQNSKGQEMMQMKRDGDMEDFRGNVGTRELVIRLADNSNNTLSDGGASEYDACIYSNGKLTIEGNGTLNVYGNQEEGEGIATETNDITINGGVINIECQDDGINAGGEIISFEAKEEFKTLIISNSKLTSGTYYLYQNEEKTNYTAQAE